MRFSELGYDQIDAAIATLFNTISHEKIRDRLWAECLNLTTRFELAIDEVTNFRISGVDDVLNDWSLECEMSYYTKRDVSDIWWRREFLENVVLRDIMTNKRSDIVIVPEFGLEESKAVLEPTLDAMFEGVKLEYLVMPSLLPARCPIEEHQETWEGLLEGFYLVEGDNCWYDELQELRERIANDSRDEFIAAGTKEIAKTAESMCSAFFRMIILETDVTEIAHQTVKKLARLIEKDPDVFDENGSYMGARSSWGW